MGFSKPSFHDYRFYLPKNFFCATVFYELHKENERDFAALDALLDGSDLRGFYGGSRLLHSETHFSEFAFDIIALLKGTYLPYALSSMYGFGTSARENGSAVSKTYANPEDVKRYQEEVERLFRGSLKNE